MDDCQVSLARVPTAKRLSGRGPFRSLDPRLRLGFCISGENGRSLFRRVEKVCAEAAGISAWQRRCLLGLFDMTAHVHASTEHSAVFVIYTLSHPEHTCPRENGGLGSSGHAEGRACSRRFWCGCRPLRDPCRRKHLAAAD